jgi:hypothetical protein
MEKLSYSLISWAETQPHPELAQLASRFSFSHARPSEASCGPADTLPLCVPWTRHHGQPARLASPFNSRRMAQARPGDQHRMNHRRLPHGDRAEELGQLIPARRNPHRIGSKRTPVRIQQRYEIESQLHTSRTPKAL